MKLRYTYPAALFLALAGATCAPADGLFSNGRFTIGAWAVHSSSLYKGEKSEATGFPYLAYDSDRLHLGFDGVGYKLVNREDLEFSLVLAPGSSPDFPKNDPLFAGLKRDTPIHAGFDATVGFDSFYLSGGLKFDVSSEHKGYEAELMAGTELSLGDLVIDVGAGARIRDRKLNNFLYGVSAAEANSRRAAYDVGATTEPFAEMSVTYAISNNVALAGFVDYHPLSSKVHKSPLTNGKDSYSIGLGLIYNF